MANHVFTNVQLISGNASAEEVFAEAFASIVRLKEDGLQYSSLLEDWDNDYASNDWMQENVGPKWAYVQDIEEPDFVDIVSAWVAPMPFLEKLAKRCFEVDADVQIRANYIDEAYNFAGTWIFMDGEEDGIEESHDFFDKNRAYDLKMSEDDYAEFEDDAYDEYVEGCLYGWADDILGEIR